MVYSFQTLSDQIPWCWVYRHTPLNDGSISTDFTHDVTWYSPIICTYLITILLSHEHWTPRIIRNLLRTCYRPWSYVPTRKCWTLHTTDDGKNRETAALNSKIFIDLYLDNLPWTICFFISCYIFLFPWASFFLPIGNVSKPKTVSCMI